MNLRCFYLEVPKITLLGSVDLEKKHKATHSLSWNSSIMENRGASPPARYWKKFPIHP